MQQCGHLAAPDLEMAQSDSEEWRYHGNDITSHTALTGPHTRRGFCFRFELLPVNTKGFMEILTMFTD
ncbi:hypothetical protein CRENBAI_006917 [Crenichthys baileyi]|uniref:Uncharacterized protein n=1 Tax=Crenichthys baileyi TaxID=28760 RepID=A0AAV9S1V2_9TELE